jgi:hypothetical protein
VVCGGGLIAATAAAELGLLRKNPARHVPRKDAAAARSMRVHPHGGTQYTIWPRPWHWTRFVYFPFVPSVHAHGYRYNTRIHTGALCHCMVFLFAYFLCIYIYIIYTSRWRPRRIHNYTYGVYTYKVYNIMYKKQDMSETDSSSSFRSSIFVIIIPIVIAAALRIRL